MWRPSESFDIWLIPQNLAYGTPKEQALISWVIRTQIGREIVWRGTQLPEGANSLVVQNCVCLSSTEPEYVAAASCCAQLLWMRQTLKDYGVTCDKVPLLCDNESAIKISHNPVQHSKTKHIEIRHHFIRDHIKRRDIEIIYINTQEQLADIFTKPLDEARFHELRHELNITFLSNLA